MQLINVSFIHHLENLSLFILFDVVINSSKQVMIQNSLLLAVETYFDQFYSSDYDVKRLFDRKLSKKDYN